MKEGVGVTDYCDEFVEHCGGDIDGSEEDGRVGARVGDVRAWRFGVWKFRGSWGRGFADGYTRTLERATPKVRK